MKKLVPYEYPKKLEKYIKLRDGIKIFFRPIKPSDADIWVELYNSLSKNTKYLRFFSNMPKPTQKMIEKYTKIDYINNFAIIAIYNENGIDKMIGVVRYGLNPPGSDSAELAVVVADKWQGKGLGTKMLLYMLRVMQKRGVKKVKGDVFLQNDKMMQLMGESGFDFIKEDAYGIRHFEFNL
ncbi:MAG: GNAT family N-acetyltransferase [Candidatus Helarchaeota archaeon]|nr:GNAT family N-acetyltransferase [Candidatus Helarchaeota archaeon]